MPGPVAPVAGVGCDRPGTFCPGAAGEGDVGCVAPVAAPASTAVLEAASVYDAVYAASVSVLDAASVSALDVRPVLDEASDSDAVIGGADATASGAFPDMPVRSTGTLPCAVTAASRSTQKPR